MHKNYKKLPPFVAAALCAVLLCSCAPASRTPQPTTAAPYEEETSADYEQLTERNSSVFRLWRKACFRMRSPHPALICIFF